MSAALPENFIIVDNTGLAFVDVISVEVDESWTVDEQWQMMRTWTTSLVGVLMMPLVLVSRMCTRALLHVFR